MEYSPGQITYQATKQAQVNSGKPKSYKAYFQPQCQETRNQLQGEKMERKKKKTHKHKDVKQYTTKNNG